MYIYSCFFFCSVFLHLFQEKQERACQVLSKQTSIREMKTDNHKGEGKVAAEKREIGK